MKTVMAQHDPSDDPFAELSAEYDKNLLTNPAEYGSGFVVSDEKKEEDYEVPAATNAASSDTEKKVEESNLAENEKRDNTEEQPETS